MGLGLINDRACALLVGAATKSAPVTTTDRTVFRFISFPSLRMPMEGLRTLNRQLQCSTSFVALIGAVLELGKRAFQKYQRASDVIDTCAAKQRGTKNTSLNASSER
jgi:hypothetical protein